VHFKVDARQALTEDVKELAEDVGHPGEIEAAGGGEGATLVGRFGARTRVRTGERTDVAVDTRSLHFFDPETGMGIYDDTKGAA
jgi:multiple sugar transport system ATP-binding protein